MKTMVNCCVVQVMCLLAAVVVRAQLPVPPVQRGFNLAGTRASTVTVEIFYDLLCPDSKSNWPVMHKVLDSAVFAADKLGIVMNIFPLPYHHHSTFVSTGFRAYMARTHDISKQIDCITKVFELQDDFKTKAVDLSEAALGEKIGKFFATECAVDVSDAFTNITTHEMYREQVVMDWKYAAARTVCGTPIFTVNGVMDNAVGNFVSEEQWESYVRRLLSGEPQSSVHAAAPSRHTTL
eukprot:scpid95822/ scgid32746/ 